MRMGRKTSQEIRQAVHGRIREKVFGSAERPRLAVYRSLHHIYAQLIDDVKGVTLAAASTAATGRAGGTTETGWRGRTGGNIAAAKEIGKMIADRAKEKGIKRVVFDRGGYIYHGRVKSLAEAAREAGLEF